MNLFPISFSSEVGGWRQLKTVSRGILEGRSISNSGILQVNDVVNYDDNVSDPTNYLFT